MLQDPRNTSTPVDDWAYQQQGGLNLPGMQPLPPVGQQPGGNPTNLPDWIARDPKLFSSLMRYRQHDPLAWAQAMGGFTPEALGSSNGLVVYRKARPKEAAAAAALAEYANRRQMENLRAALEGRQPQPSALGEALQGLGGLMQNRGVQPSGSLSGWGSTQSGWGQALGALGGWLGRMGGGL